MVAVWLLQLMCFVVNFCKVSAYERSATANQHTPRATAPHTVIPSSDMCGGCQAADQTTERQMTGVPKSLKTLKNCCVSWALFTQGNLLVGQDLFCERVITISSITVSLSEDWVCRPTICFALNSSNKLRGTLNRPPLGRVSLRRTGSR